jgi:hypothetical protein
LKPECSQGIRACQFGRLDRHRTPGIARVISFRKWRSTKTFRSHGVLQGLARTTFCFPSHVASPVVCSSARTIATFSHPLVHLI